MTITAPQELIPLTEHVADWRADQLQIDDGARLVRNVVLSGTVSRNGHRYTALALAEASALYHGKPVFLDHAANAGRPLDRSTRDLVGTVINARAEQERILGDIQVLDTEAGRTFLALIRGQHPSVGMSHVVLAQRGRDGTTVEKIHEVISVDAVVFPATTRGLREARSSAWPGSWEAVAAQLDERLTEHVQSLLAAPTAEVRRAGIFAESVLVEALLPDASTPQLYELHWEWRDAALTLGDELRPAALETLHEVTRSPVAALRDIHASAPQVAAVEADLQRARATVLQLREQLAEREAADTVDALLAAAGLPHYAITPLFREQLLTTDGDAARHVLIQERQRLLRQAVQGRASSRTRQTTTDSGDRAFVRAIRGTALGVLQAAPQHR